MTPHVFRRSGPKVPIFIPNEYPPQERDAIDLIARNLSKLSSMAVDMHYTMQIFERASAAAGSLRDRVINDEYYVDDHLRSLTAKIGAIELAGALRIMNDTNGKVLAGCPSFAAKLDVAQVASVINDFKVAFSDIETLRNSVAHPESHALQWKTDKNSVRAIPEIPGMDRPLGPSISLTDGFVDGVYIATHAESVVKYRPGGDCAESFQKIVIDFLDCFKPAAFQFG